MSDRFRLARAREELTRAMERGNVPSWLVGAVTTTLAEARSLEDVDDEGTRALLSRAETLVDLLESYRTREARGGVR